MEPELITQTPEPPTYNILLVDDDSDIRSLTRTFLEHEGYHVLTSGNAERAAQIFRNGPPISLLIADVYLPERSGIELARELKSIQSSLLVLVISGGMLDTTHLDHLRTEGWTFLAKPFRLPQLLACVHEILQFSESVALQSILHSSH